MKNLGGFLGFALLAVFGLSGCSGFHAPKLGGFSSFGDPSIDGFVFATNSKGESVYDLVTQNCAGCHAGAQSPYIAVDDVINSHDTNLPYVNLVNSTSSRLYVRLSTENHNCWGNCQENAAEMKEAIDAWIAWIDDSGGGGGGLEGTALTEQTIPAGLPTGEGNYVTMTYPLDEIGLAGATFQIDIQEFEIGKAYKVINPRINGIAQTVQVTDLKLLVNGVFRANETTYTLIDTMLAPPGGSISPAAMIMTLETGAGLDSIMPLFRVIQ